MRICFFGDSFVNGTGDDDCLGWVGRLCAEARARGRDITLYNLGIRRDMSGDVAGRWEREADARLRPEHDGRLIFSFGVNDCVHEGNQPRVSEDMSLRNARTILERARATRPTLMVGPPCTGDARLDERVQCLSDRLEALCRELVVPMLPTFRLVDTSQVWRREAAQGDGVHPNRGGYTLIYQAVLNWQPWRDWVT
jgi:lysophospholipase L1-like esterase